MIIWLKKVLRRSWDTAAETGPVAEVGTFVFTVLIALMTLMR